MMEKVRLTQDLEISRLVYGMWRLGDDDDTSATHVQAKIEACLAQGITTMDQADIYGGYEAEEILGHALKAAPDLRDRIEIITKCGIVAPAGRYAEARVKYYDTSADHIAKSIDHSLRLMGIDQIDLLLIHRPDPFMDHQETGQALDNAIKSGKVCAVGCSNFRPWDMALLSSAMENKLVTNQIEISLTARDAFTNGDIAALQQAGTPPMAWSPLGGGSLLTGKATKLTTKLADIAAKNGTRRAAVAVAWLLAHPAKIVPVLGTNNLERIAIISDALKVKMDRETWFELYTLAQGREVA